jgi:hypothetical protein
MANKAIKFINFKIEHLEKQLKEAYDTDSKQHSKYIELESQIYILKDLINDLEVFLNK